MKVFINKLPLVLILSRMIIGIIIFLVSFSDANDKGIIVCWLIVIGFLSDFFDGYIARILGISNQFLRRIDTIVDRVFWLSILYTVWSLTSDFLITRVYWILLVLGLEMINYMISFIRFHKEISTHAILSKLWAVTLLFGFCDLILNGKSSYLFDLSILFGIISRIDTGLIMLILPAWDHDIPSFYHAIIIKKGKEIKRFKIFNG
jgi:CDP-diacylglycerol---glycerol-3-phosphate 3-phosphatidyltransferase